MKGFFNLRGSIGDHEVAGVEGVDEGSCEINGAPARVTHFLLGSAAVEKGEKGRERERVMCNRCKCPVCVCGK